MKNSETYIITAKTVDEAMAIAQREYGGAGKDISFDILEMPKKGFLGIGAKDAKIKVTVTEEETISLSSIVDEMRSYRIQTDREGDEKHNKNRQDKPTDNRQNQKPKADKPADKPTEKPAPAKKEEQKPAQPKPVQENKPKPEQKPQQPKAPAQPKADKPVQPKPQQNQEKPTQSQQNQPKPERATKPQNAPKPVQEKPAQEKPAEKPVPDKAAELPLRDKPTEPVQEKPVQKAAQPPVTKAEAPKADKPEKVEARADGILDSMPAYTISDNRDKTPVYKETGANVKTYTKSAMHTAAVADGSLGSDNTPVADVRWDSARDLKKAEEATAAAIAAATPKAVDPISAEEAARVVPERNAEDRRDRKGKDNGAAQSKRAAAQERYAAIRNRKAEELGEADPAPVSADVLDELFAEEEKYIPSDGSIDVAALDAAIEAMVEDLPAPEARKKVGITAAEMEHALAFVTTLLANMQIDAVAKAIPCPEGEEIEVTDGADVYPAMEIVGDGTGILIGHHGETLDAIQYLLNLAAIRHSDNPAGDYVKISLDIENYRAKREETLRSLARRMAARALKYKRNVFLEPMNAYERRIIHSELQLVEGVSTHSVGTDKNRKIIITYEGADRVMERRTDGNREGGKGRRDNRGRNHKKGSEQTEAPEETAVTELPETEAAPQGEQKPRNNRNRNRNRNRRRNQLDLEGSADIQTAAGDGASAIIPPEEREELDRQLTDPGSKPAPQKKQPEVDVPAFLQRPADEPAEHLREN